MFQELKRKYMVKYTLLALVAFVIGIIAILTQIGGTDMSNSFIVIIVGVVIIILGLYLLIKGLSGGALKSIKKYCVSTGNEVAAMQRLEQFCAVTPEVAGIRVSQEFFMARTNADVLFAETRNIIWIYMHVVRHSVNYIPTGKTYSLMAMKADGTKMEISMRNKKKSEEALDHISRVLPYLYYGYDDQLMAVYNQNRQSLIQAVADRRAQFMGTQMPEMQMPGEQMMPTGQ